MENFDISKKRKILDGDCGTKFCLKRSFENSKIVGGLASSASHDIICAIYCILVKYDEAASKLLAKAHKWLKDAIETDERPHVYVVNATEGFRHYYMAMANWLISGEHDDYSMKKYIEYEDRFIEQNREIRNDKFGISLTLPDYLDAGEYVRALELFERTKGLKPPVNINRIGNEAGMVYVLSRFYLGLEYDEPEVKKALNTFLNRNVNIWLVRGHADRAALWMKIAYWNKSNEEISPREAIMKCYDHLPGVNPP